MKRWIYAYIVIAGLLLLMAPASALVPDGVEINTSSEWLTAGSGNTTTITILVTNGTTPIPGAAIAFAVEGAPGSISPAVITTNSTGWATAVFSPATTSGTATITATVSHEELAVPLARSVDQQIDHAAPDVITGLWYDPVVTVGGTTNITVRMADRYGNEVDDRRTAENVRFMVGAPAGFVIDGSRTDEILVPVDATGNATATLRVDTVAGENLICIQPPAPVKSDYISIIGVADGVPYGITLVVAPGGASVPADGASVISFTYTLYDEYENPAAGHGLWVNTSVRHGDQTGEPQAALLCSNSLGQVAITYGPEDSVGVATITAAALGNESVTNMTVVVFTSTEPVNMVLSASPQSVPSRDVKPDAVSELRAKVMDVRGNPVAGEEVSFEIVSNTSAPYNQTLDQVLADLSATTDDNGYATVGFYPGAFTTNHDAPGWDATATGTATVRATWKDVSREILLTWKNYPYLSVETEVTPETVAVGEPVDVTIRLKGDGWALQPDPIDVVLCTDRSGSMLYDDPDRMHSVREAAKAFVDQFSENYDRAGTVSFGRDGSISRPGYNSGISRSEIDNHYIYPRTYNDHATLDVGLTYDLQAVRDALDGIVPDHGTPLRHGLKVSIDHLVGRADDGSVRAVVLLTDGDYNWYGDPLARGTGSTYSSRESYGTLTQNYYRYTDLPPKWQNMSAYAVDNDIRIFTISYSESLSSSARSTLRKVAESTGGKYYHAPGPDALGPIYTDIAGSLKTEAGVDTQMDISFENVEVNSVPMAGGQVFDYIYSPPASTQVYSYFSHNSSVITGPVYRDDTPNWTVASPCLHFNIGTVRLNQVWETTFRLNVTKPGNINIFGPDSVIRFNDDEDALTLPDTFITAIEGLNNTGMTSRSIDVDLIDPVPPAGQDAFFDAVPLVWNITYNGTCDVDEALAYSNDGGLSWRVFLKKTVPNVAMGGTPWLNESTLLDVRDLLPGEYQIRVITSALDTPEAMDITNTSVLIGNASGAYIKLE